MPQIFKALASITAWILFVGGVLTIIFVMIGQNLGGGTFGEWPVSSAIGILNGNIALIGAVVVMKLRQNME